MNAEAERAAGLDRGKSVLIGGYCPVILGGTVTVMAGEAATG
jgi:hypothetical protein